MQTKKRIVAIATAVLAMAAAALVCPASAAVFEWQVPSGGWSGNGNWVVDGSPGLLDDAVIDNGGTSTIDILNAQCANLWVGPTNLGYVLLDTAGNSLTATNQFIGGSAPNTSIFYHSNGANAATQIAVGWMAGTGIYQMSGLGTAQFDQAFVGYNGGTGIVNQSGGTVMVRDLQVGVQVATGFYNLTSGTLMTGGTAPGTVSIGETGTGFFNLGDASTTGTACELTPTSVSVWQNGTFRGWGTPTWTAGLENSGKVIADGYGVSRDLDLRSLGTVTNTIDNPLGQANGWYAVNRGRLILPTIHFSGGLVSTGWWGDKLRLDNPDHFFDMVNSMFIGYFDEFAPIDATVSLLALDRPEIDTTGHQFIGVWHLDGPSSSGEMEMAIRYDDLLAASLGINESDLKMFHSTDGINWTCLDDPSMNPVIYTDSNIIGFNPIDEASEYFAVGVVPEPATLSLLALGGLAMMRRRRYGK